VGKAKFRTTTPPKPLNQYGYRFKYITKSTQEVDVQNLVKIDLAVTALHMRKETRFSVDFGGPLQVTVRPMLRNSCPVCSVYL